MSILHAAFLATVWVVGGAGALLQAEAVAGQAIVTREWTWTVDGTTTTFTAQGPADQVSRFDPHGSPTECPDCTLASSIQYGPIDGIGLD